MARPDKTNLSKKANDQAAAAAAAAAAKPKAGGTGVGGLIGIAKKGVAAATAAQAAAKQKADAAAAAQAAAAAAKQNTVASSGAGVTIPKLTSAPGAAGITIPSGGGPGGDISKFFGVGGLTPDQLTMLLGSGGFGQELQYQLGLLANQINALKQAEDAHHNAALEAIASGQLALAQKEEQDANAVQVERNRLTEYQTNVTAQSSYASDLMKLAETPENAYKYAFARYGQQAPGGGQSMALPLPAAVKSMVQPPTTNTAPQRAATQGNPLIPGQTPGAPSGSVAGAPPPGGIQGLLQGRSSGPSGANPLIPQDRQPEPNPIHDRLMAHALDMAKIGGNLIKSTATAPPAAPTPAPEPQTGAYQQAPLPTSGAPAGSSPANPLPSGQPAFATGGIAGLGRGPGQVLGDQWQPQAGQPPARPTPTPSPVNENQNLGGYTGPWQTLDPYLQQLFAQTGHPTSGIPLTPPSTWKIPQLGTPSTQSMRGMTPTETANVQGYERDVEGKPIDDFKSDIERHNEIGQGLTTPTDFGSTTAAPTFAGGGIAGLGGPPPPQAGATQVPGIGQVSSGPGTFGEPGNPEAAVPLNSPGGPLAMAALQANQGANPMGAPPGPPPPPSAGMAGGLSGLLGGPQPTSRDVGPMPTTPILPLADVPNNKLGPGDRGHAVAKLQQALERAGYLTMPPGANYGFYGPVTTQAVAMLQSTYPDPGSYKPGYWDAKSAKWLKSQLQGGNGPQNPDPNAGRDSGLPGELGGPVAAGGPAAGGDSSQPGGLSALMSL